MLSVMSNSINGRLLQAHSHQCRLSKSDRFLIWYLYLSYRELTSTLDSGRIDLVEKRVIFCSHSSRCHSDTVRFSSIWFSLSLPLSLPLALSFSPFYQQLTISTYHFVQIILVRLVGAGLAVGAVPGVVSRLYGRI